MKAIIVACLSLMVTACMPSPAVFSPGNVDRNLFNRDDYECERDARSLPNADACAQMSMYERCMKVRGYEPTPGSGNKGLCAQPF